MTSFLRNCHFFTVPILVFSALFLASCVSRESFFEASALPRCEVWVRYLPETDRDAQFRLGVRPVPMDNGWTELRMKRDIERIKASSIDVAMVEATPMQLSDEWFLSAKTRLDIARKHQPIVHTGIIAEQLIQGIGACMPPLRRVMADFAWRTNAVRKFPSAKGADTTHCTAVPKDVAAYKLLLRFRGHATFWTIKHRLYSNAVEMTQGDNSAPPVCVA